MLITVVRINNTLALLPFSWWLRICSKMAAKFLNSGEESSIVSKQDRSIRVFTENLWGKKLLLLLSKCDFIHWVVKMGGKQSREILQKCLKRLYALKTPFIQIHSVHRKFYSNISLFDLYIYYLLTALRLRNSPLSSEPLKSE